MTPTTLPAHVRDHMSGCAAESIDLTESGNAGRRAARLRAMRVYVEDVRTAPGGASVEGRMVARGTAVLIDAAEDLAHGVAGELTDAGIAAAEKAHGCVCPPAVIQTLRALWDFGVATAFSFARRATR